MNRNGLIVRDAWFDLKNHYHHVELGAFVIMPNHAHGMVVLIDEGRDGSSASGGTNLPAGRGGSPKMGKTISADGTNARHHCQKERPTPTSPPNTVMPCLKSSVRSNHFRRGESIDCAAWKGRLPGREIITSTSSAITMITTESIVTSNPTRPCGRRMMKTRIANRRGGSLSMGKVSCLTKQMRA